LARQNREALVRIPPLVGLGGSEQSGQLRLEYRGADAAANPHLALGAIVRAGIEGIRAGLECPPILDRDPAELDAAEAARFGVGAMPESLEQSLQALEQDAIARAWLSSLMLNAYTSLKRAEIEEVAQLDLEGRCRRYASTY
jgi:glutamine synthetase